MRDNWITTTGVSFVTTIVLKMVTLILNLKNFALACNLLLIKTTLITVINFAIKAMDAMMIKLKALFFMIVDPHIHVKQITILLQIKVSYVKNH